jgi:hypothetical protein
LKRVERDPKVIAAIAEHVTAFAATVAKGRDTLRAMTADSAATVEAFRGDDSPF